MLTRALWVAAILGLAAATTLEVRGFDFNNPPTAQTPQELDTIDMTTVTSVCRTKAGCYLQFQGKNTRVQTIASTGTTGIPAVNPPGETAQGVNQVSKIVLVTFDQTLNFADGAKTVNYNLRTATRRCQAGVNAIPLLTLGTALSQTQGDAADPNVIDNTDDSDWCEALCDNQDACTYWVHSTSGVAGAYKRNCALYSTAYPAGASANAPIVTGTIQYYGACPYDFNNLVTYKVSLQFEDIWDTASTFQTTVLNVMPVSSTNTNARRIAVPLVTYTPEPTYTFACTGLVECSNTESFVAVSPTVETLNFVTFVNENSRKFGYVWVRPRTGKVGAHKFGVADQPAITIRSSGTGTPYTIPLSLSGLFAGLTSANFAPGVISANGEVGKAVSTATPNTTLEVNSIRSQRVLLDDEFRTVASGIVYAAVGSAFAFVLCLGAVAAAIGSKAAAKGVTQ